MGKFIGLLGKMMKTHRLFLIALLIGNVTCFAARADNPRDSRAQVKAALEEMAKAANAHDVDGHVGFYAHDPRVTLIVDGEPIVGWDAIRDKQREWWNDGKTDVAYEIQSPPEVRLLAPDIVVTTLSLKGQGKSADGTTRESKFAVSAICQKRPEGWRIIYSHESTSR